MPWILLTLAGLFEIGWAIGLKYTDGFTKPLPTVLTAGSMVVSIVLLGLAVEKRPMGTAESIRAGLGPVGGPEGAEQPLRDPAKGGWRSWREPSPTTGSPPPRGGRAGR